MGLIGSLGQVAYDIIANDKTGNTSQSAQRNMMAVGAAFTGVGVASKLMVDDCNASFLEFDKSQVAVKALGAMSEEEFGKMREAAIGLSTQVPVSATEVTDAMYKMVSVGYDFDTMMATIPEATKLAVGGNQELSESVDTVINVMGAYGTEAYTAADITNILAKAVGVGKWELGDFTSEIMRNIGAGANLGISFNELAAANVLLQNRFTSSEVAGTSMNAMLTRLVNPSVIKKLEEMGVHVKDNEGNFVGLESVLNQLDTALQGAGGNVDRMSVLQEIFGQEGVKAALALLDEKEALKKTTAEMNDATFKNEAYNTVLESTSSKLEIAENKMNAAKIALGEGMAPATELLAGLTGGLAAGLALLPEPLQGIAGMGLFAAQGLAGLGPLLMGLAGLKGLGLAGTLTSIATSISSLGSAGVTALVGLGPLLPILAGVALGLAAVYAMQQLGILDWFYDLGYVFGGEVIDAGGAFMDWLESIPDAVGGMYNGVVSWFSALPGEIANTVMSIPDVVGGAFDGLTGAVGSALSGIPAALAASFGDITTAFAALGGSVQEAFSNLFTGISEFIVGLAQGFISAGYNIIMYIVQGMQSAAGSIASTVGDIFGIISDFIPHSPAKEGPLSVLPNFSAYLVDPLLATVPQVQAASLEVAAAATMPVSQPAAASTNTTTTTNDNSVSIGNINASKDYSITDIIAEIAAMQALKRTQRGITS